MKRWMVLVLIASGCGGGPSDDQCKQLLDHLTDLEFKKAGVNASTDQLKAELAKQKASIFENKQSEFMKVCVDKTAKSRVVCALAANDLEAVAKCDDAK